MLGCGGRMPADDIIDRSYSVLAAGILTGVDDTIAADDCTFTTSFPFLVPLLLTLVEESINTSAPCSAPPTHSRINIGGVDQNIDWHLAYPADNQT